MTSDADRILAWVGEQKALSVDRDTDSIMGAINAQEAVPILAQIVREYHQALLDSLQAAGEACDLIHAWREKGELGHELRCRHTRASIRIREALSRAAAHLPQKGE